MKIKDIIQEMEKIAPPHLACVWDKEIGLQVGSPEQNVSKVLVTLDVTEKAIQKAIKEKAQLIIAHHALLFKPVSRIDPTTPIGKKIALLIKNNIALYVAHTNLDAASKGVNYWLAKKEGLDPDKCAVIDITYSEELIKLAVFTPKTHVEKVRDAISLAGAGHIGNYSHCSFNLEGTGTFKPLSGTNPYIGQKGKLESVKEIKIETIVPKHKLKNVLAAMFKHHPYEEVAYDLYPLANEAQAYGLGLIGSLPKPKNISGKKVRRLAVCGGGAGSIIEKAYKMGAQALVIGECSYHEKLLAKELGLIVIQKGHWETEKIVLAPLASQLGKIFSTVKFVCYQK